MVTLGIGLIFFELRLHWLEKLRLDSCSNKSRLDGFVATLTNGFAAMQQKKFEHGGPSIVKKLRLKRVKRHKVMRSKRLSVKFFGRKGSERT